MGSTSVLSPTTLQRNFVKSFRQKIVDKYQAFSLGMSALALVISSTIGYFQYQTRLDNVEERIKVELKMAMDEHPLSPLDLRMISGVAERTSLESVILVTNIGNTPVRILEVGYQDLDLPNYAFYSGPKDAKNLYPGEQAIFKIEDLMTIQHQLIDDIRLGNENNARIFAVSTRGNRFEAPAILEVAK